MAREETEKRKYWEEKINEYKKKGEGKSQNKWCKENKISSRSFNYWYCKFKIMEVEGSKTKGEDREEDKKKETKWISVKVEEKYEDKDSNESGIIINVGKAKIGVNKGFDSNSLLDVLRVVNLLC